MYSFHRLYSSVYPVKQLCQPHMVYLISHSQTTLAMEEILSAKYTEAFMGYIFRIN